MRYLLDVNALIALVVTDHSLNPRMVSWTRRLARRGTTHFITCAITELGFIRILTLPSAYGRTVSEAQSALHRAKASPAFHFTFIPDAIPGANLPGWASRSSQVTDGHLMELAKAHGVTLATLDAGIPGAFLIPA